MLIKRMLTPGKGIILLKGNKINKRIPLYFFKHKPEMIHCFVFKTNFVGAYFEYFHQVAKLFIIKIFGQERGVQIIFFQIKLPEFLSPSFNSFDIIIPPAAFGN